MQRRNSTQIKLKTRITIIKTTNIKRNKGKYETTRMVGQEATDKIGIMIEETITIIKMDIMEVDMTETCRIFLKNHRNLPQINFSEILGDSQGLEAAGDLFVLLEKVEKIMEEVELQEDFTLDDQYSSTLCQKACRDKAIIKITKITKIILMQKEPML